MAEAHTMTARVLRWDMLSGCAAMGGTAWTYIRDRFACRWLVHEVCASAYKRDTLCVAVIASTNTPTDGGATVSARGAQPTHTIVSTRRTAQAAQPAAHATPVPLLSPPVQSLAAASGHKHPA